MFTDELRRLAAQLNNQHAERVYVDGLYTKADLVRDLRGIAERAEKRIRRYCGEVVVSDLKWEAARDHEDMMRAIKQAAVRACAVAAARDVAFVEVPQDEAVQFPTREYRYFRATMHVIAPEE